MTTSSLSVPLIAIVLAASLSSIANAQSADIARGKTLFQQRCVICHSVAPKKVGMGPNLAGVVGRKAGTTSFNYSSALKNSGVVWSANELDAYLAAPAKKIPGARMALPTPVAGDRRDIIGYLSTVR
jgi:cytochrome c